MNLTIAIKTIMYLSLISVSFIFSHNLYAQSSMDDSKFIKQFIDSKGYTSQIVLSPLNIKQFWVDKSILSKDDFIVVALSPSTQNVFKSIPLNIQLTNVYSNSLCQIDVISKRDLSFDILDSKGTVLSASKQEDHFLQYYCTSSKFSLSKTDDFSFKILFSSDKNEALEIKAIILSFSEFKSDLFHLSSSLKHIERNDIQLTRSAFSAEDMLHVSGTSSMITTQKYFPVEDKGINTSVRIRNIGNEPTKIYVGYIVYSKDGKQLSSSNYPLGSNSTVFVISAEAGSSKIIIDKYTNWTKGSYIARNTEDDLSDIPNTLLLPGRVVEITKLQDNQAEITLDSVLKETIAKGTRIRIHGKGGSYLYSDIKTLKPGIDVQFSTSITLDNNYLTYSAKNLSRGVYFIKPVILSYSSKQNTIQIDSFLFSN